jgi:hypothetical protein
MIQFPANGELKKLRTFNQPFCLSAYIPLEPDAGPDAYRIVLKNARREAAAELVKAGACPRAIKKTLAPMDSLINDSEHWPTAHEGLAVFAHAKLFRHYRIPAQWTPHLLAVKQGFMLGPVLDAMRDDARYILLFLNHNRVQLFEGSHYEIHPIHPKELPVNMKEALRIDEYPRWQGTHEIAPAYMGKGSEAHHAQYNVAQTNKAMLTEFFHQINKRLRRFLRGDHIPLIIGGVDYLLPLYRHANTYPHLLQGSVKGNLERASLDDLRERAWEVVRNMHRGTHLKGGVA